MAQTVFVNVTLGKALGQDAVEFKHTVARGASASGDLTVSLDVTKAMTLNQVKTALAQVLKLLQGGKELT